jgi:hypothetical protein
MCVSVLESTLLNKEIKETQRGGNDDYKVIEAEKEMLKFLLLILKKLMRR